MIQKDKKRERQDVLNAYHLSVRDLTNLFMAKFLEDADEIESYDYYRDIWWAADDIGGTFCFGDYYINFSDVVEDLKSNSPQGLFEEWYWETLDRATEGKERINYCSYIRGARHETDNDKNKE